MVKGSHSVGELTFRLVPPAMFVAGLAAAVMIGPPSLERHVSVGGLVEGSSGVELSFSETTLQTRDPFPVLTSPDPEGIALLRAAMLAALKPPVTDQTVAEATPVGKPPEATSVVAAPDPAPAEPSRMASTAPVATALPSMTVPLPIPRPRDLVRQELAEVARPATLRSARRQAQVVPVPPAEEPSIFERIFGTAKPAAPDKPAPTVLAYASTGGGEVDSFWRRSLPGSAPSEVGPGTAVYDISARVVHMPNGEKLEAHSGLGESMDNPKHVHITMKGPTPPGVYDLRERESAFHGVRAIRLTPVGGGPAAHGRVGLLAHTYMLRQPGASNGCVVFKEYDRFLQSYLKGEIKRLVVVAGRG